MTVREHVIQEVLQAPPRKLRRVLRVLREETEPRAKGKKGEPADKPFKAIGCGSWRGLIPESMSSVEWVRRLREQPRGSLK